MFTNFAVSDNVGKCIYILSRTKLDLLIDLFIYSTISKEKDVLGASGSRDAEI